MRGGNFYSKRGVSTVVAVVLTILVAVALSGLVFVWARGFVSKSVDQTLIDKTCENIDFIQGQFCYNDGSGEFVGMTNIEFDVRNNAPDSKISGFSFFLDYGKKIVSISTPSESEVESSYSKRITSNFFDDFGSISQIAVAPKISVESKMFVCEEKKQIVSSSLIKECE
jgi:hypothetical protein